MLVCLLFVLFNVFHIVAFFCHIFRIADSLTRIPDNQKVILMVDKTVTSAFFGDVVKAEAGLSGGGWGRPWMSHATKPLKTQVALSILK